MKKSTWLAILGVATVVALAAALWQGQEAARRAEAAKAAGEAKGKGDAAAPKAAPQPAPATKTAEPALPVAPSAPEPLPAPNDPVREIPRKKLPEVKLDLDFDGKAEILRVKQQQPAKDWQGKDKAKGPRFTFEVRSGAEGHPLIGKRERYGWGQGWAQAGIRVSSDRHVAMLFWSVPESQDVNVTYAWLQEGKLHLGEFDRVPLRFVDLRFAHEEAVLVMSHELYQDFLKRGTMQLLAWTGGGFEPVLEQPAFEVCVAWHKEPVVRLAVVEKDQRTLKLLDVPPAPSDPFMEVDSLAVTPATEGPRYTVPTGFALSCDRATGRLQYKGRFFDVTEGKLTPVKAPAAPKTP